MAFIGWILTYYHGIEPITDFFFSLAFSANVHITSIQICNISTGFAFIGVEILLSAVDFAFFSIALTGAIGG
ncbi:hypothetical protein AB0758_44860 [Tolypothrix bouteillei VB521301_2]